MKWYHRLSLSVAIFGAVAMIMQALSSLLNKGMPISLGKDANVVVALFILGLFAFIVLPEKFVK